MNGSGAFLIKLLIRTKTNIFVISRKGGTNMFFANYRARKQTEKQKQEYLARIYPAGFADEPKREPNPDYQLKGTEQDIYGYLVEHHTPAMYAKQTANNIFSSMHWKLYENLDEVLASKPLSNIIVDNQHTLKESLEMDAVDPIFHSVLSLIQYLSLSNRKLLLTPDELNELYLQVQQDD